MEYTTKYYVNQAGNGLNGYQAEKLHQKGRGFLGDIFKSNVMPLLSYLGKQALNTGIGVAQDAVMGDNILSSVKRRAKRTAQDIAGDLADRADLFAQTGNGRKKRKKSSKLNNKRQKVIKRKAKRFKRKSKKFSFLNGFSK